MKHKLFKLRNRTVFGRKPSQIKNEGVITRRQNIKEHQEIEIQDSSPDKNTKRSTNPRQRHTSRSSSVESDDSTCSKWSIASDVSIASISSNLSERFKGSSMDRFSRSLSISSIRDKNSVIPTKDNNLTKKIPNGYVTNCNGKNAIGNGKIPNGNAKVSNGMDKIPNCNGKLTNRYSNGALDIISEDNEISTKELKSQNNIYVTNEGTILKEIFIIINMILCYVNSQMGMEKFKAIQDVVALPISDAVLYKIIFTIFTGVLADVLSLRFSIFISHLSWIIFMICDYMDINMNKDFLHIVPITSSILLGSQLIGISIKNKTSLEVVGVLSRLSFFTTVFHLVCQKEYIGYLLKLPRSSNIFIMNVICLIVLIKICPSDKSHSVKSTKANVSLKKYLKFLILKLTLTLPHSLLITFCLELTPDHSIKYWWNSISLSISFFQVIVLPLMTLFSTINLLVWIISSLLMFLYPCLILLRTLKMNPFLALIPICGLISLNQTSLCALSILENPTIPGINLATNLALHTGIRYLIGAVMPFKLLDLNVKSIYIGNFIHKIFSYIREQSLFYDNLWLSLKNLIHYTGCDVFDFDTIAVIGCICSFFIVIFMKFNR